MDDSRPTMKKIGPILSEIGSILNRHDVELQGAVLANAVAVWLCEHTKADGSDPSDFRRDVLEHFLELVIKIVPLLDAIEQVKESKETLQ